LSRGGRLVAAGDDDARVWQRNGETDEISALRLAEDLVAQHDDLAWGVYEAR
jgi:hypothetical protein